MPTGTNPTAGASAVTDTNETNSMSPIDPIVAGPAPAQVKETTFTADHPAVVEYTAMFKKLSDARLGSVFGSFHGVPASAAKAVATGTQWMRFSESMTRHLPLATSKLENLEARHFMVQTAFEELGERDADELHAKRFGEAAALAGVTDLHHLQFANFGPVSGSLAGLTSAIAEARTDARILGIGLGLEIPAEENIQAVFQGLVHGSVDPALLRTTKFFAVHFQNEPEHIRLSVANFLRFVRGRSAQSEFMTGFEQTLEFWERFWTGVGRLAHPASH